MASQREAGYIKDGQVCFLILSFSFWSFVLNHTLYGVTVTTTITACGSHLYNVLETFLSLLQTSSSSLLSIPLRKILVQT